MQLQGRVPTDEVSHGLDFTQLTTWKALTEQNRAGPNWETLREREGELSYTKHAVYKLHTETCSLKIQISTLCRNLPLPFAWHILRSFVDHSVLMDETNNKTLFIKNKKKQEPVLTYKMSIMKNLREKTETIVGQWTAAEAQESSVNCSYSLREPAATNRKQNKPFNCNTTWHFSWKPLNK